MVVQTLLVYPRVLHMNHSPRWTNYPSIALAMELERVHHRQVKYSKEWTRLDSTRIKGQSVYRNMITSMSSTLTAID